jgi:hypothetical protein
MPAIPEQFAIETFTANVLTPGVMVGGGNMLFLGSTKTVGVPVCGQTANIGRTDAKPNNAVAIIAMDMIFAKIFFIVFLPSPFDHVLLF